MKRVGVIAAVVVAALGAPAIAHADDAACIQSYESTQTLRKAGKLRDARADAAKCADTACPAVLTKDCAKWQAELDAQLPTIVVDARDGRGQPVTNITVTANGKPLDGGVDPGTLTLHIEGNGKAVEQTVTLKAGEKGHRVSVTLGDPPPAANTRPFPLGPVVFGAAGIVAVGVGAVFAVTGHSSENDLDKCKGHCSASDVNSVSTKYAVSDILFTAGAVSLVAAAYMFLTRPNEQAAPTVGAHRRRSGFVLEF